jgi:hypothetical protein
MALTFSKPTDLATPGIPLGFKCGHGDSDALFPIYDDGREHTFEVHSLSCTRSLLEKRHYPVLIENGEETCDLKENAYPSCS